MHIFSYICIIFIYSYHIDIYLKYIYIRSVIGLIVFANGLGDQSSILGRIIPKTQKMVLDSSLLSKQSYKIRIKGKVEQSREWSSALSYHRVAAIEKGAFGSPSTMVANFTYITIIYIYTYVILIDIYLLFIYYIASIYIYVIVIHS